MTLFWVSKLVFTSNLHTSRKPVQITLLYILNLNQEIEDGLDEKLRTQSSINENKLWNIQKWNKTHWISTGYFISKYPAPSVRSSWRTHGMELPVISITESLHKVKWGHANGFKVNARVITSCPTFNQVKADVRTMKNVKKSRTKVEHSYE